MGGGVGKKLTIPWGGDPPTSDLRPGHIYIYIYISMFTYIYIYIYTHTSVLLCTYIHKPGWTREVRGRMIRSIDGEYKRIEILTEHLSQIFSQSTQTRSVDAKGSELSTLKYVLSECKHPKR